MGRHRLSSTMTAVVMSFMLLYAVIIKSASFCLLISSNSAFKISPITELIGFQAAVPHD